MQGVTSYIMWSTYCMVHQIRTCFMEIKVDL